MRQINCLRPWIRRCVALTWRMSGRPCWRIPLGLSVIFRTIWLRRLKRPSRKRVRRHCCCMWLMQRMCAQENIDAVDTVLEEIDAHEIPSLMVMNKIDMLDDFEPRIDRDEENKIDSCLAFRADRGWDTTAFSGFDGATFRRGGAAYVAFAAAGSV